MGNDIAAPDLVELGFVRAAYIREVEAAAAPFDAIVMPTVPCVAPTIAEVDATDEAYFKWNARVQNGPTIRWQSLHQLTFGLGDCSLPAELPDMGLADVQNQPDPRRCDVAEIGDVANSPRTHLRHEEPGPLVDTSDREWY